MAYTVGLWHFENNRTNYGLGNLTYSNGSFTNTYQKFGTYCIYGGSVAGTDLGFGTGDFTIDFWLTRGNNSSAYTLFDYSSSSIRLVTEAYSNALLVYTGGGSSVSSIGIGAPMTHIAIVRYSGSLKVYANGSVVRTVASSTNYATSSTIAFASQAYVDELRISKGIARWTANFTPPTSAYNVSYTISGYASKSSRVYVLDQTTNTLDTTFTVTPGNYSYPVSNLNNKTIVARALDNSDTRSYGAVTPTLGGID